jgi:hypothetical protein
MLTSVPGVRAWILRVPGPDQGLFYRYTDYDHFQCGGLHSSASAQRHGTGKEVDGDDMRILDKFSRAVYPPMEEGGWIIVYEEDGASSPDSLFNGAYD